MCNMTHSQAWHDSFICVTWLIHKRDMTHSRAWHDLTICAICQFCAMCNMTDVCHVQYVSCVPCAIWQMCAMCNMSDVCHDPCIFDMELIHVHHSITLHSPCLCIHHQPVCRDSFTYLICLHELTHSHVWSHNAPPPPWRKSTPHVTHAVVYHDPFRCVIFIWLMWLKLLNSNHTSDVSHSYHLCWCVTFMSLVFLKQLKSHISRVYT